MKDNCYQFFYLIIFNVNYSNAYRLRAEVSWVHSAFSSNLLLTYTQHSQRILQYISVYSYINSEILTLNPCKLPFIEPWCDLSRATKNLAIERLTLLMLKKKSRKAPSFINCYCKLMQPSAQTTHKPCYSATKVTVCVNKKPIKDGFTGFKLIVV